jgi:hypothetical protein
MKLSTGVYKLNFHTGEYFTKQGVKTLYPFVEVSRPSALTRLVNGDGGLMIDYVQLFGSIAALSYSIISQSMELYNLPRELEMVLACLDIHKCIQYIDQYTRCEPVHGV